MTIVDPRRPGPRAAELLVAGDDERGPWLTPAARRGLAVATVVLVTIVAAGLGARELAAERRQVDEQRRAAAAARSSAAEVRLRVLPLLAFAMAPFRLVGTPARRVEVGLALENDGQSRVAVLAAEPDAGSFRALPTALPALPPNGEGVVVLGRDVSCPADGSAPPETLPHLVRLVVDGPDGPRPVLLPLPEDRSEAFARSLQQACGFAPPEQALQVDLSSAGPLSDVERRGRFVVLRLRFRAGSVQPARLVAVRVRQGLRGRVLPPTRLPLSLPPGVRGSPGPATGLDLRVQVRDCATALRRPDGGVTGDVGFPGRPDVTPLLQRVEVQLDIDGRRPVPAAYDLKGSQVAELVGVTCPRR